MYFFEEKTSPVLLFAGSVLITSGFVMHASYKFDIWNKLWPFFILSFAIAVLEIYLFNGKERGMLILFVVIAGLSCVMIMKVLYGNYYWDYILAMVLISLGLIVIFVEGTKDEQKKRSF
jgi:peptidoglycan/LPS O-acetylase OafA/YrhL